VPDDRVGPVFSALADEHRRRLVETLAERETASLSELAEGLPMTRQAVSKHLAALERGGLVTATRSGRETRYRLTPAALADVLAWVERVGAQWDARLAALREHLTAPTEPFRTGPEA
jgi:DNA-binding transcriptional ArsR family regulator